jgi:4a-hydroxytetrahydrobiopterin dehydratase
MPMSSNKENVVCSLDDMSGKKCIPCSGDIPPLETSEKHKMLGALGEGWHLGDEERSLTKRYKFKNFKSAWAYAEKLAVIAEEQFHHPDLKIGWGYVEVLIQTHKINNLVESDFIFAAKAEKAHLE